MSGSARPRSFGRRLALAAACMAVALAGAEVALRALLFGDGALGERLRVPSLFADSDGDAYWALVARLRPRGPDAHPHADPVTGWRNERIAPDTYAHAEVARLEGRRPVLLYGDSFAACLNEREICFESLLERSPLGATHALLNYGCNGYGLGQAVLLFERSVAALADLDPLVVLAIHVDADLERTLLTLREHPKPGFRLEEGELVITPPAAGGRSAWLEAHGVGIHSYLGRLALRATRRLPAPLDRLSPGRWSRLPAMLAVNRAVLARFAEELRTRGLQGFLWLLPGEQLLAGGAGELGLEQGLRAVAGQLELPLVRAQVELEQALAQSPTEELFRPPGSGGGHYDERGNAIAFASLLRGLEGRFDD